MALYPFFSLGFLLFGVVHGLDAFDDVAARGCWITLRNSRLLALRFVTVWGSRQRASIQASDILGQAVLQGRRLLVHVAVYTHCAAPLESKTQA